MKPILAVLALSLLVGGCASSAPPARPSPLYEELAAKDKALFDAVFTTCDTKVLNDLLTEDFEFYHDKWGQVVSSREQFVGNIRGMCERQKTGEDYRARRDVVPGTLAVYPMKNYGAVQSGEHRFYRLPENKLTESARFTHLWKQENGQWRLARVLSYDHVDAK
jgi:hypothetical protein